LVKGIEHFKKAIDQDPNYAAAYAGLADSYIILANWGIAPPGDEYKKARAAALKALELDDELAEAHTSLAYATLLDDWDWGANEPYQALLRLLRRMLGELFGCELASLHVAFIQFRILLPLLRQIVQRENRGYRADWDTGATIDAFHGIDVELGNTVERSAAVVIGRVLLGVDAIYGTGVDAGGVFGSDAGFGNDIGHRPPPPIRIYGMPSGRKIQAEPS